jgi:carbonic anhydrase/acetyltransferase-like protein (isoleucine patch superfamily)
VSEPIAFEGVMPKLGRDVFVAPTATLVGQVTIGDQSSIWFGAVLRGDVGKIHIGARTNVQDLSVLHMTGGISATELGDDVTIGHAVTLHGCRIGHRCLVGIGSILLDNVELGEECFVAAGSLLPPRLVVPARSFVLGRPARVVRPTTEREIASIRESALRYVQIASKYR